MTQTIAFLRGMNVGGRRIKNPELCAAFEGLGLQRVFAFLASGNVVFSDPKARSEGALTEHLESGLKKALGYEVPVFLRSAEQVRALGVAQPFDGAVTSRLIGKMQVALLKAAPTQAQAGAALKLATPDDAIAIDGAALFWLPKGGFLDSALSLKGLADQLGEMTIRTQNTMVRLAKKLD